MPRHSRKSDKDEHEHHRERPRNVKVTKKYYHRGEWGGAYFLGFLGALVYYIQGATTGGQIILGILKAIVWPAMVVYHVLGI